ncbi:MAG TPA: glycoside hydrolase family 2 TIM barrel-domain containing protein [Candidatus Dormibacteraeota bacterium]|nr:glycoside hydrolase family 2 TIM barrel-domain containing protein [Candidatus Dormibacteraeota bacterium]
MPGRWRLIVPTLGLAAPLFAAACSLVPSAGGADLAPTLSFKDEPGGPVAFQGGQPVPTFDREPRLRIGLDGTWRFQAQNVNTNLSLTNRASSLKAIEAEVAGRDQPGYDDTGWAEVQVPGSFDPPARRTTTGGFYRLDFFAPAAWKDQYATLKFGAVRYIADVWLNGHYLGYHEGGDTPFALGATQELNANGANTLLVRVDNPMWGTRDDIVPWGLADWWNYGGMVGDVWLEATPALSVVRADVTPHLDGADVSIVVQHRGTESVAAGLDIRLWPAQVTTANLLDPNAFSLVPPDAKPLLDYHVDLGTIGGESVIRTPAPFAIRSPALWSPGVPALYVLDVAADADGVPVDQTYTSFGLRQVRVDSTAPRILLNGDPIAFNGVALHEERQQPAVRGQPAGGPLTAPADLEAILVRAMGVHADLVRVDHHPPNQMLPVLADRLGLAVWEEIPLYHYTPQTFSIALGRGIAQQMLAEMDLRDFNRPSVLFHGFANESTGGSERAGALNTLHALDRRIDGTRLTGQAAYALDPSDQTSAGLDVAGYTIYYGVLYGGRLSGIAVQNALAQAHREYPTKPIMVLEFGHWADNPTDEAQQQRVFNTYYAQISSNLDTSKGGYVGAAVWWALDDYWSERPGLAVETFGLYRPNGSLRPAGASVRDAYGLTAPPTEPTRVRSTGVAVPIVAGERHSRFLPYIGFALALPAAALIVLIALLSRVRRRPAW